MVLPRLLWGIETVTVPAAFIAAAMLAMANGAASGMSNDQEMWPNVGRPIHGVALSEAYVRLSMSPAANAAI